MPLVVAMGCGFASPPAPVTPKASAVTPKAFPSTVQTLAGPAFCPGSSELGNSTAAVQALAVGRDGNFFFDTGDRRAGLVGQVGAGGRSTLVPVGAGRGADSFDSLIPFSGSPAAGRLAADGQGGLLVAAGAKILHIDQTNNLASIFGDPDAVPGKPGRQSFGDGGPAPDARFLNVRSLATDETGNLYLAEQIHRRSWAIKVRFINRGQSPVTFFAGSNHQLTVAPGHVATIAGRPGRINKGDGGPALQATITGRPPSLSVASGRLYLGLYQPATKRESGATAVVRMINLTGEPMGVHGVAVPVGGIQRVAGRGPEGFSGDNHPALSSRLSYMPGIATDGTNLYLAEEKHHRVRRIDPEGALTTVAGVGRPRLTQGGFNGNDRQARKALLNRPYDVKVGPAGLYIADQANNQVRTVDRHGVIRVAPGSGLATSARCRTAPDTKQRKLGTQISGRPVSIDTDPRGTTFFTLEGVDRIMQLSAAGLVTPFAGRAPFRPNCAHKCLTFAGDGGRPEAALLSSPSGLLIDPRGNMYFSDSGNYRLRFINRGKRTVRVHGVKVNPGTIRTILGDGSPGSKGDGRKATKAQFSGSDAMALDRRGNLYLVDEFAKKVRKVDSEGVVTTFAGEGARSPRDECCKYPAGVAADASGYIFVSNLEMGQMDAITPRPRIWVINQYNEAITAQGQHVLPGGVAAVAGNGDFGFGGDGGKALDAELSFPTTLVIDRAGNLIIGQEGDRESTGFAGDVRRVDTSGTISRVAGNGLGGFNGDGQKPQLTSVSPSDIAVLKKCGDLVIADRINGRIRLVSSEAPCRRG